MQTPLHEYFLHQLSPSYFVTSTPQFSNRHQGRLKLAFELDLFLCGSELTPDGLVTAEFGHMRTASQLPSSYRVHTRCFRCSVNLQHPERAQQEARHDSVSGKGLTLPLGFVICMTTSILLGVEATAGMHR